MAMIFASAPPKLVANIETDLKQNATRKQWTISTLSDKRAGQLSIDSGHRVYSLGLDEVAAGYKAKDLKPQAWRFLVKTGGASVAAAESDSAGSARSAAGKLAVVNAGPFVESTARAFAALAKDSRLKDGDSEPRLLRIPALYVMALWLHDSKAGKDRVQVLAPAPEFLSTETIYSLDEFMALVREPARARLAFDDSPQ
jgi:hypothetical protein